MKKETLLKIKEEVNKKLLTLDSDNDYAKRREEVEEKEKIKSMLGLPYNRSIGPVVKSEEDIIMEVYKKYEKEIEEKETNGIYIYDSSYTTIDITHEMYEQGYPFQKEVEFNDPCATHRYYYNLEGLYVEEVNIEDVEEFEKQNIVIYGIDYSKIHKKFICDCIKNSQEEAIKNVLKLK